MFRRSITYLFSLSHLNYQSHFCHYMICQSKLFPWEVLIDISTLSIRIYLSYWSSRQSFLASIWLVILKTFFLRYIRDVRYIVYYGIYPKTISFSMRLKLYLYTWPGLRSLILINPCMLVELSFFFFCWISSQSSCILTST